MAESKVQKKLSKLIQQELSGILQLKHVYVSGVMITVSVVKVPADLSLAKVYVAVLPDDKLQEVVDALNKNAWEVRRSLAGRIKNKVRKIPELRFYEDDSYKEADRISRLLGELTKDLPEETQEEPDTE